MNIFETIKNFFLGIFKKIKPNKKNIGFYVAAAAGLILFIIEWITVGFIGAVVIISLGIIGAIGTAKFLLPWLESKLPDEEK
jgi:hypothetical protein